MKEYVIILAEKDLEALGHIRCWPQARAAAHEGRIWLRGIFAKEQPAVKILQLPAQRTYRLDADNRLFPPGALTPERELPRLDWRPLSTFLPVDLPVSALPGKIQDQIMLKIVPATGAGKGAALLTEWPVWAAFVDTAPAIRLSRLRFAASADGKALVLGDVLPPLPGREYWMRDGVLLPGGYDFEFPVVAELVQKKYNPKNDALLLFDESGRMDSISKKHIVQTTRSAVRLTGR